MAHRHWMALGGVASMGLAMPTLLFFPWLGCFMLGLGLLSISIASLLTPD